MVDWSRSVAGAARRSMRRRRGSVISVVQRSEPWGWRGSSRPPSRQVMRSSANELRSLVLYFRTRAINWRRDRFMRYSLFARCLILALVALGLGQASLNAAELLIDSRRLEPP